MLGGEVAGFVSGADLVKETTPAALKELHALGLRIIMATGDNERTAKAVAARLSIDEIRADVLPRTKRGSSVSCRLRGRRDCERRVCKKLPTDPLEASIIFRGQNIVVEIDGPGSWRPPCPHRHPNGPSATPPNAKLPSWRGIFGSRIIISARCPAYNGSVSSAVGTPSATAT